MENRETLKKNKKQRQRRLLWDSGSLTATVILISLTDISLLFVFNMKIFL